jgi:methylated-DNA-[protein]-cysteine S-methyltransferase
VVLEDLASKVSARILGVSTPAITTTRRELDENFDGRRRTFDVPLDWTLTKAFRREVLHATTLIPYGETSISEGRDGGHGARPAARSR